MKKILLFLLAGGLFSANAQNRSIPLQAMHVTFVDWCNPLSGDEWMGPLTYPAPSPQSDSCIGWTSADSMNLYITHPPDQYYYIQTDRTTGISWTTEWKNGTDTSHIPYIDTHIYDYQNNSITAGDTCGLSSFYTYQAFAPPPPYLCSQHPLISNLVLFPNPIPAGINTDYSFDATVNCTGMLNVMTLTNVITRMAAIPIFAGHFTSSLSTTGMQQGAYITVVIAGGTVLHKLLIIQ